MYNRDEPGARSSGVACAVIALEYLRRAKLKISPCSIHRLFVTAFLVALKYLDDFPVSNQFFSQVAGCSIRDLNFMELNFCALLGWNCHISFNLFEEYLKQHM